MKRCERSLRYKTEQEKQRGFPGSSAGKKCACDSGEPKSIPGFVGFPGEGIGYSLQYSWASLVESACNGGHLGSIPGLERSPEVDHGNPLQYSCLENPLRTQEPGGLQSMGFRVAQNWATKHSTAHENKSVDINKINHVNNGLWRGEGWERGSRRRGHIYSYVWFPLLYGRNQHYIVKQLASK